MTEGTPRAMGDASLGRQVIHREAEPADIAGSVFLLAADEAGWITRQTIMANGGKAFRLVRVARLRDRCRRGPRFCGQEPWPETDARLAALEKPRLGTEVVSCGSQIMRLSPEAVTRGSEVVRLDVEEVDDPAYTALA